MTMRRQERDEETVWTHSFSPVQGENGGFAGVLLLATEMTSQKKIETALTQAQAQLAHQNATLEERVAALAAERDQLWRLSRAPNCGASSI
jgi:signal transduction histidine kinase